MEILKAEAAERETRNDEFFSCDVIVCERYVALFEEAARKVGTDGKDTLLTKALCLVAYFSLPKRCCIDEKDDYRFFKLCFSYSTILLYLAGIFIDPSMYNYLLHTLLVALANHKFFRRTFDYYGNVKTSDKDVLLMRLCFLIDSILGISFALVGLPYQLCIIVFGSLICVFVLVPIHSLYQFIMMLSHRNDMIDESGLQKVVSGFPLIILPSLFDVLISRYLIISEAMFYKSLVLLILRVILCFYDYDAAFLVAIGV